MIQANFGFPILEKLYIHKNGEFVFFRNFLLIPRSEIRYPKYNINMKAIVFSYHLPRLTFAMFAGKLFPQAYLSRFGPTQYTDIPEPTLPGDDWCIVRVALCGICGSDTKQLFLDAEFDNPLSTLVSFPNVPGHEVVGVIEQVGPKVKSRKVGERVALNPWLSCVTRGIDPPCPNCQKGNYFNCEHFLDGNLPPGMHHGNCRRVTGGYAALIPAHESQLFPIPDGVSFEQAVLADPFSVSLHAILKAPPKPGEFAVVYGCGTLGMLGLTVLHDLFPGVRVVAIARSPLQEKMAYELGVEKVIRSRTPSEIIQEIARLTGQRILQPDFGMPWLLGGVQVIYDTVGSAETIQTGLRILSSRGSIVITGVSKSRRYEWTPHYFKEINLMGSNAFGIEEFEGQRMHAMQHFLRLLAENRLHLPPMVTHHFRLEQYKEALMLSHNKDRHQAIKTVFDFQPASQS